MVTYGYISMYRFIQEVYTVSVLLLSVILCSNLGHTLFIQGCPMFGCRPSGSFSYYLQIPRNNVSIKWASKKFDPVPQKLGCVANSYSVLCPNNGPFREDTGYQALFPSNGTTRWRDQKLHYPTLPLLDDYGDVTGSDGVNLVHYDADGSKYPEIPCQNLKPVFNLALVGNSYLLLVSGSGYIVVRETNGVPVGSLTLNDTIQNVNGSFIPISQPVVNIQRFYVLTKFVPNRKFHSAKTETTDDIRLYAIDVRESIDNRITIAWYIDIKDENKMTEKSRYHREHDTPDKKPKVKKSDDVITDSTTQALLWNRYNKTVYVVLGTEIGTSVKVLSGVRDLGKTAKIEFQASVDVKSMAMFVSDHCEDSVGSEPYLWVTTTSNLIQQISSEGNIVRTINMSTLFNASVTITSKLSVIRNSDVDKDLLVLGIAANTLSSRREMDTKTYVVAMDTMLETSPAMVIWSIPLPDKMVARGQIAGRNGLDVTCPDHLIVYADDTNVTAQIYSIS
ncbi:hypothetical protein ACF0H5_009852 [Mactra antiquata]